MRTKLFALKPSYVFLLTLLVFSQTTYGQQAMVTGTSYLPTLIEGLYMDAMHHKVITSLLVAPSFISLSPLEEILPAPLVAAEVKVEEVPVALAPDSQPVETLPTPQNVTEPATTLTPNTTKVIAVSVKQPKAKAVTENDNAAQDEAVFEEDIDPLVSKYAEMISTEPAEINNYSLYRFIDKWYGIPYKWGGMDFSGIDCSAFSKKLYGEIYGVDIRRTARQQRRSCERIHMDDANEGDLVFFHVHSLRVSHVGVYLANGYFVHASKSKGVMISSLNDRYWRHRYAGCGRIEREDKRAAESDFAQ